MNSFSNQFSKTQKCLILLMFTSKPNCSSYMQLCRLKKDYNLRYTNFSNILVKFNNREIGL